MSQGLPFRYGSASQWSRWSTAANSGAAAAASAAAPPPVPGPSPSCAAMRAVAFSAVRAVELENTPSWNPASLSRSSAPRPCAASDRGSGESADAPGVGGGRASARTGRSSVRPELLRAAVWDVRVPFKSNRHRGPAAASTSTFGAGGGPRPPPPCTWTRTVVPRRRTAACGGTRETVSRL